MRKLVLPAITVLLVANAFLLGRYGYERALAQQLRPGRTDVEGTFRLTGLVQRARSYELLVLDPASQTQIQAELIGRLAGRLDGRVEATWLDPYRPADGGFRMFYLISWEPAGP